MKQIKIIIEKHRDGYAAYPVGIKGIVVGEGDTYEEALKDVQSAIKFHIEAFGPDVLDGAAANRTSAGRISWPPTRRPEPLRHAGRA